MAAHTHWRLYIGAMSNIYAQMGTVSFLNAAQVNQSTGGTATASSEYSGSWAAGNAFDGNPASEWASAGVSSSEWIAYQHPSPVDIVFVGVKVSTSYPVSGLALQYSDDGVSWSDASPLYLRAGQPALTSGSYTVLGLSASRRPLVLVGGRTQELPEGDTLPPQTPATHSHATSDVTGLDAALDAKQDALVSGTNVKTINGTSLLGSGNITTIPDAPSDGKTYGRKDAAWSEAVAGGMPPLPRSVRTSNTMLGVADKGKLIDITSGTFSQTFDAVATLGDEWCCWIRNSGTGDITLDPNSTETIDGVASFVLYPGAVRVVLCDGTALYSIAVAGGAKTFTTSGSYVWAPGIQQWSADLIAGGAGGGGGARAATRYDGGGGGAGERWKTSIALAEVTVGASTTCAVGAKGTGGAAGAPDGTNGASGTAGGVSSIGSLRSVSGGSGVNTAGTIAAAGQGGGGGGMSLGTNPTAPMAGHLVEAMVQGSSIPKATEWGGPAGRRGDDTGANGVQARLGGQRGGRGGAAVTAGTAGANGANPGDGGDGGAGNTNGSAAGKGGDGADGKITIVEVL